MNTFTENPLSTNSAAHNYHYPLRGLELLSENFLLKAGSKKNEMNPKAFLSQLEEEACSLQLLLKTQAFALGREKEIKMLVQRYHISLTQLLDDTLSKKQQLNKSSKTADGLYHSFIAALENILAFIKDYFPEHYNPDQRVPMVSLSRQRKDLVEKLNIIEQKILSHPEEMVAGELFRRLRRFAASGIPIPFNVRYRDLRYKEELLKNLDEMQWKNEPEAMFTPVEQLLIYLNYNSKGFIRLLTKKILHDLRSLEQDSEKLDNLLLYQKAFRQIHPKPGLVLNPGYYDLRAVLDDWFDEEVHYLEKRLRLNKEDIPESGQLSVLSKHLKVLLSLSADQAALIIRGADEARIVIAKSMSAVFKSIAPHISTPYREHVSPEGMRSKAYHPEQHDKDKAIAALETIIRKIRDY